MTFILVLQNELVNFVLKKKKRVEVSIQRYPL